VTHEDRKAEVKITRVYCKPQKEFDRLNIFDKSCVDVLVELEILKDDSPKWAYIDVDQEETKRFSGTRIEWSYLDS